jgi:hypothetical protein
MSPEGLVWLSVPIRWDYVAAYLWWNTTASGPTVKLFSVSQGGGYLDLAFGWFESEWTLQVAFLQQDEKATRKKDGH